MQQIGRYQIIERIGRGAMGVVYRARDPRIGRSIAVKSIRIGEISDPSELKSLLDRLEREARSAGALSHPHLVTIYDILEEEKLVHLFMEYVNGPSLDTMLSRRTLPSREQLLQFLEQIASGLDYAHKVGIVHRDIKPSNLMLHFDRGSGEQLAKITDFGVAKFMSQQMTRAGSMMGTPNYMAPEQIEGADISGQTDQFALAGVVYEIFTGTKPFVADYIPTLFFRIVREAPATAQSLNPTLSSGIDEVLQKALAKNPSDRFETCAAFIAALSAACAAQTEWMPPFHMGGLTPPVDEEPEPPAASPAHSPNGSNVAAHAAAAEQAPEVPAPAPDVEAKEPANPIAGPAAGSAAAPASEDRNAAGAPTAGAPTEGNPPFPAGDTGNPVYLPYDLPPPRRRQSVVDAPAGIGTARKVAIAVLLLALLGLFLLFKFGDSLFPQSDSNQAGTNSPAEQAAGQPDAASKSGPENTPPKSDAATPLPVPPPAEGITRKAAEEAIRKAAQQAAVDKKKNPRSPIPAPSKEPAGDPSRSEQERASSLHPRINPTGPAEVRFTSEPAGALVVVDHQEGAKSCKTPCLLSLPSGRHTMSISARQYGTQHRIFQVPEQHDIFIPLTQNIGIVQVDSIPTGSSVYVDGRLLGQTPTTLKLTSGPHQFRLVLGSRSHQENVEVNADSLQNFTFRWQ